MEQSLSNRRIILTGASLLLIGLLAWWIYVSLPRTQVHLQIAPDTARLSIDGKDVGTVSHGKKITVAPGKHTLKLSREEFSTEETTVTVEKDQTVSVLLALTPQTDAAWAILRGNSTSVAIFEGYGAKKSTSVASQIEKANPLYKKLPINTREYYIYLCPSLKDFANPLKRSLCVDVVNDQLADKARSTLVNAGFDLAKEEVYVSTDPATRPILKTSEYDINYHKELNANNKPTFAFLVYVPFDAPNRAAQLVALKDKALTDFKNAGFIETKVNIVYVNPELHEYNSSEDIEYPGLPD